jgi:hypothetical protein
VESESPGTVQYYNNPGLLDFLLVALFHHTDRFKDFINRNLSLQEDVFAPEKMTSMTLLTVALVALLFACQPLFAGAQDVAVDDEVW